jgi:hypothetical protein
VTRKTERPLYLDMPFDEALTRYVGSKPDEVQPPPGKQRKAARPKPGGQVVNADALPETGEPPKPD